MTFLTWRPIVRCLMWMIWEERNQKLLGLVFWFVGLGGSSFLFDFWAYQHNVMQCLNVFFRFAFITFFLVKTLSTSTLGVHGCHFLGISIFSWISINQTVLGWNVNTVTRNIQFFGFESQQKVSASYVVVIGLGGVGSHAATMLLRSGIGKLLLVDFDQVFSQTDSLLDNV